MFGTTIAPMAAAVNLIATSNQQTVNTIIAGQAALMSKRAEVRRRSEANNVVDMKTTESDPAPVDTTVYYKMY